MAGAPQRSSTSPSGHSPAHVRNIALVGHGGAGKTTLVERVLLESGEITRMGTVEDGNTVSDWTEEERHHQHSLRPGLAHFEYEGHLVHLIDTPGLADFFGHAVGSLPAVETVAVVVDAVKGVQTVTRRIMEIAKQRNLPRMIIINKIDDPHADPTVISRQVRKEFGNVCLPINLPLADGSGVVNTFENDAEVETSYADVPAAHTAIIEQVVETDEALMTEYLEVGADGLDQAKVHAAFAKAMREGHLVPMCYVSAKTGQGADDLRHIFASMLPSPEEGNPRCFMHRADDDGPETELYPKPDSEADTIAHIFSVASDPFVGKLGIFRVHQGTVRAKDELYLGDSKKPVRIGHLLRLQGKDHVEVDSLGPGEIGAVTKIDDVRFNGVFHSSPGESSLRLRPLPMPKPMYGLAIELTNRKDESKFAPASHRLMDEDPSLVIERIEATRQTVMNGLGELHLRVVQERLKDQYGIELETSIPKVAYLESITGTAEGHHRHKKQSGGSGEFAEVHLRVSPLPTDHPEGFEFVNATVGGSVPRQFMPAIEKGCRQLLTEGAVAGYPLTGIRVEVYDGKHHAVDSKEVAFIKAGKRALIDAIQKANPALLEPFVHLEVTVPQDKMGDITSDLSNKRGRVQDTLMLEDAVVVKANAPLSELRNYSNELKSITAGSGSFVMDYSHDERAPAHIQQEVVAAYDPHGDDD